MGSAHSPRTLPVNLLAYPRGAALTARNVLRTGVPGVDERHEFAQFRANLFDRMRGAGLAHFAEARASRAVLGDPLFGELPGLDLVEDALHFLLGVGVHDARTARVVAVLGRRRDRIAHARNATGIHEI